MSHPEPPDRAPEGRPTPPEPSDFAEILLEFEQQHTYRAPDTPGEVLKGTVVAVTPDSVILDVGKKMEGVLPAGALKEPVKAGDIVHVSITGFDPEGYYTLTTVLVEQPKDWASLEKAFAEGRAIKGTVVEAVKGGLRVDVGVPAFLPASRSGAREQPELEKLIGQDIQCKIIKLDVAGEDVVVDRRVVLEEEEAKARQRAFEALQEGQTVRGVVRSLTDYGAFVDLGGFDGLLHVTDMSWGRIGAPSDLLAPGQELEVKILKINPETRKISLGLKQLTPDPWTLVPEKYKVGSLVRSKVARLTDFGAFVELEPGVDGLIRLSELSWSRRIKKPADVLRAGETVEVKVLEVNGPEHRISLGLKQALGDPWDDIEKRFPLGAAVEGRVSNLTSFGAFVELQDGVEGMIHIADITRQKRLNHPKEALQAGQTVRAQILELDREKRRIRLGMKQLEPTTVDEYISEHQPGDVVTGRLLELAQDRAKVELGEGVVAACSVPPQVSQPQSSQTTLPKADVSTLSALLSAKWKQGKAAGAAAGQREPLRVGQIRSFRILAMNAPEKRIEVELLA